MARYIRLYGKFRLHSFSLLSSLRSLFLMFPQERGWAFDGVYATLDELERNTGFRYFRTAETAIVQVPQHALASGQQAQPSLPSAGAGGQGPSSSLLTPLAESTQVSASSLGSDGDEVVSSHSE